MSKLQNRSYVHSLHNMWITMKSHDEEKAINWLNALGKPLRNALAAYWTLHGFGYYVQYLKLDN